MEFDEHAVYQLPGASSVHYSSSVSKISACPWPRGSTCFSLPTRPVTRIESGLHIRTRAAFGATSLHLCSAMDFYYCITCRYLSTYYLIPKVVVISSAIDV